MHDDPLPLTFTISGAIMVGLAVWALVVGDVGSALLAGTVGSLFLGTGLINLSDKIGSKPRDDVVKTDDPEGLGQRIGFMTAIRLHNKHIEEAEIREREKKAMIDTPVGRLYTDLTYDRKLGQWVVSVPEGVASWNYYHFDNYDDALKFYEGVKKGILEFFRGGDDYEGN